MRAVKTLGYAAVAKKFIPGSFHDACVTLSYVAECLHIGSGCQGRCLARHAAWLFIRRWQTRGCEPGARGYRGVSGPAPGRRHWLTSRVSISAFRDHTFQLSAGCEFQEFLSFCRQSVSQRELIYSWPFNDLRLFVGKSIKMNFPFRAAICQYTVSKIGVGKRNRFEWWGESS
jgi:hypothetical protein